MLVTFPKVCIDENLTTNSSNELGMQPWSVPRLVKDIIGPSGADGALGATTYLPGLMLINLETSWYQDAPIDQMLLIRVTRGPKSWVTSNPNAIQFRDRWSHALNQAPAVPSTSGLFNSQVGSAIDFGTNTVAEPNPGVHYVWKDCHSSDEWVGPISPSDVFQLHYRCYVWTPPPWSDNANKNNPTHNAFANFTRIQLISFPTQGNLVTG